MKIMLNIPKLIKYSTFLLSSMRMYTKFMQINQIKQIKQAFCNEFVELAEKVRKSNIVEA